MYILFPFFKFLSEENRIWSRDIQKGFSTRDMSYCMSLNSILLSNIWNYANTAGRQSLIADLYAKEKS